MAHALDAPAVLLYPRIRKSPYFYASRKHGVAAYSVYNHTYHPRHYGDPVAEYWRLLEGVTLWDVGVERQLEISGPDAFAFANLLTPRDLTKCAVGQCKYAFITGADGGILNDPVLLRLGENRIWLSLADSDIGLWAQGLAHFSDYDVNVREIDVAPVQVQGPRSKDVMVELFGDAVLEVGYYHLRAFELDAMQVVVSRTGYTAELGYEIYLHEASRHAQRLWDAVLEAGARHDIAVIGPSHIRRIEAGILSHGADMWFDTTPYEVGYDQHWMVDLDQEADFVGKDALRRVRDQGVSRLLVGVEIGGSRLGSFNDGTMIDTFPVYADSHRIGQVTSACHSPRLDKNIGYAMVPIDYSARGTRLEVEVPTGRAEAVVVEKPFVDPTKQIPKA